MCTLEAVLGVVTFYFLRLIWRKRGLKNIINTPLFRGKTYTYTPERFWKVKKSENKAPSRENHPRSPKKKSG